MPDLAGGGGPAATPTYGWTARRPAAWSLALAALLTFVAYAAFGDSVERARSALTAFSILCGLVLVLFAAPPTARWTGGEEGVSGWPTVVLFVPLLAAFAWVMTSAERSAFFDLGALQTIDLLIVTAACAAWATALRWMWRAQLLERALGFGLGPEHRAQLIGEDLERARHL